MKVQLGTVEVSEEARKALAPTGEKFAKREVVKEHLLGAVGQALKKLENRGLDAVRAELEAKRAKLAEQQQKVDAELSALGADADYDDEPVSAFA